MLKKRYRIIRHSNDSKYYIQHKFLFFWIYEKKMMGLDYYEGISFDFLSDAIECFEQNTTREINRIVVVYEIP